MEPRFEDLRSQLHNNKDIHVPVYVGGTEKADLWLLTDAGVSRQVLVCQYDDSDVYVSYSPPYAVALDALGEYDHAKADQWIGQGLRDMPTTLCLRWGHPTHHEHNAEQVARYVAIFLPDYVPPELRARILDGENHD
jgi:hypothetical protein